MTRAPRAAVSALVWVLLLAHASAQEMEPRAYSASPVGANFLVTANSQNAFAMTVGGGLDYRVSSHFSVRAAKVDYLLTRFNEFNTFGAQNQNNLRVSTGIVFRF